MKHLQYQEIVWNWQLVLLCRNDESSVLYILAFSRIVQGINMIFFVYSCLIANIWNLWDILIPAIIYLLICAYRHRKRKNNVARSNLQWALDINKLMHLCYRLLCVKKTRSSCRNVIVCMTWLWQKTSTEPYKCFTNSVEHYGVFQLLWNNWT